MAVPSLPKPAGRTDTGVGKFFFPSVNYLTLLDRFLNDAS